MESINALKIIVQHPNKSGNAGGVMRVLCQDCMLPEAPPMESDAGSQTKTIATGRVSVSLHVGGGGSLYKTMGP